MAEKGKHDIVYIFLTILVFFLFAFTQIINALAALGPEGFAPWFTSTTESISDKYTTEITPAGWTFIIWAFIYVWQLLLILFILFSLCVKNKNGDPIYTYPPTLSSAFLAVYALNLAINITWLFLFDREEMVAALVFIVLLPITMIICLSENLWRCNKYGPVLYKFHRTYLILNRVFIQNGLAIYGTWTSIASLINLAIVLTYDVGLSTQTAALISLSLLTVVILTLAFIENTCLEHHFRYILTPWWVIIWALSGVLSEQWDTNKPTCIFTLVLVCLAGFCMIFKYIFALCRLRSSPIENSRGDNFEMNGIKA